MLRATSVADDLGIVALADIARLAGPDGDMAHRVIGGHMVTALVTRWRLGDDLRRETNDVDLGVPPVVMRDPDLVPRLLAIGYQPTAGNRFVRTITDLPVRVAGEPAPNGRAVIDILVPSYTSRARRDRRVNEHLVTTEVPGLATALRRPPIAMSLELHRLNDEVFDVALTTIGWLGARRQMDTVDHADRPAPTGGR